MPCKIQDFSRFQTGLGSVLRLLSVGSDKEEIKRLCDEQKDTYENLGREDAEMLEVFMNKRFIRDEGEEETCLREYRIGWMRKRRKAGQKVARKAEQKAVRKVGQKAARKAEQKVVRKVGQKAERKV